MKLPKIFNKKKAKRNKMLMEEYEKGRILQVNNKVDNKEFLKKK